MFYKSITAYIGIRNDKYPCTINLTKKVATSQLREYFFDDQFDRLSMAGELRIVKAKITWEDK